MKKEIHNNINKIINSFYFIWGVPFIVTLVCVAMTVNVLFFGVNDIERNGIVIDRIGMLSKQVDSLKGYLSSMDVDKINKNSQKAGYKVLIGVEEISSTITDITTSFDNSRFKVTTKTSKPIKDVDFPSLMRVNVTLILKNTLMDNKSLSSFNSSMNRLSRHPKKNNISKVNIIGHENHIATFEVVFTFWISK